MDFSYQNEPENAPVVEENVIPEAVAEPIAEAVVETPKKKAKSDLVTIYSPKKVTMDGVAPLNVGLNQLTKEDADKWLAAKYYVKLVEETNK